MTEQQQQRCAVQPEQTAPQPIPESTESVSVQNPPDPQENTTQPTITNTTTSIKEKPTMNENTNITHTVSAPVQTYTPNHEPEKELNPLDELTANTEGPGTTSSEPLLPS